MKVHPHSAAALRLLVAGLCLIASMALSAAEPVGRVLLARGDVEALAADGTSRALVRRDTVFEHDTLVTGPDGRLQVRFDDGAMLELRAATRVDLATYRWQRPDEGRDEVLLKVLGGGVRSITGAIGHANPAAVDMETPVASIGIRGTHFSAVQEKGGSWVFGLWEGGIRVANKQGSIDLGRDASFLFARVVKGQAPVGLVQAPGGLDDAPAGASAVVDGAAGGAPAVAAIAAPTAVPGAAGSGTVAAPSVVGVPINPAEGVNDPADLAALSKELLGARFPLSDRERAALAGGTQRGVLVNVGGQLLQGVATTGDDGHPVVLFDLPDGSTGLLRTGEAPSSDSAQQVGGFDVSWGTFRPGPSGLDLYVDDGTNLTRTALGGDVTVVQVDSAGVADLTVDAAYSGTQAIGTTSAGAITNFGVFFDAALDLGSGRIRDGHLLLEAGSGAEEYRVNFEGLVDGGQANLAVTRGTISGTGIDGTLDVDRDLSSLQGLFTSGGSGFAAGFTLQQAGNADRFARGAFVANKVSDIGGAQDSASQSVSKGGP